ncbi:MAG: hypothetical protein KZQ64_00140 [gamma proteobacterium symbiont of Bathyaustriella thionipta]|nr:hypothetical protein [gamma proteobacterium symbiont of Bathyaustriella thionipta]MCU7950286.1 hypothetical protein [gamma proteobacterium symbiont of Bathyaustriella thionipta]MCU7951817.1 hypothetical protein [gamma proteobacterium symbiont of Bathyaustriella thionipta]MCU7957864.1 hypothetical protein [gamma proteobacterium symbiont of Bathyaustriella thionipta]MCU7965836.1 hypothetical protein [gamma proteobacterium symbiont of Bathyaustriella thionipta]
MDNETEKKQRQAVRISAMNMLAGREHSIVELRNKLKKSSVNVMIYPL